MKSNKILFIILFIVLFCFCFSINSFAAFTFERNNNHYSILDIPSDVGNNYVIMIDNNIVYLCYPGNGYLGKENLIFRITENKFGFSIKSNTNWATLSYKSYDMSSNNQVWTQGYVDCPDIPGQNSHIVYSTQDIIDISNGEVFFQKTLPAVVGVIQEVTQLPGIIKTVLKVIIPVGLIVLSVVFLIYLIKSVISRVV